MTHRRRFLESIASALTASWFRSAALARPLPGPDDAAYWDKVRDQFMLARDKVFFNNGTIGAMPRVVFEKTVDHLRKWQSIWRIGIIAARTGSADTVIPPPCAAKWPGS